MSPSTLIFLLIALVLVVWWVARLVATIRRDGYGTRRPPASHRDWTDELPWTGTSGAHGPWS